MKLILILITTFIIISNCKRRLHLQTAPLITDCPVLLPVAIKSQTIFYNGDPDSEELNHCLLKNSHSEQTVNLLSVHDRNKSKRNFTDQIITTVKPNVIVILKSLTTESVHKFKPNSQLQFSHWILLYIVVTSEKEFICENGMMRKDDFSRLDYILNQFWHKFKIMSIGIVFPLSCKQKMVIYDGKRLSNQDLIYDRTIKLINATNPRDVYENIIKSGQKLTEHFPLRATIFYREPTSITKCNKMHYYRKFNESLTGGFCGLDGMMMHDILTYFKFNISFPNAEKCFDFGYEHKNKTVSGSLGCIVRKEADISFNGRFMTKYKNETVYYLHYVTTDSLCALVKRTGIIPLWHGTYNVYDATLWLIIITILVTIGIIMWVTAVITQYMIGGNDKPSIWFYLHDTVMSTMFGYTKQKHGKFLMLRGISLMSAVFFGTVYQGHINHEYTTLQRFEGLHTLEQLYKSGSILYTSPSMQDFLKQLSKPEDKLQNAFFERTRIIPRDRLGIVLQVPLASTIDRRSDVRVQIHNRFLDKNGKPLISIVDQCFYTYYLCYITRPGFAFYEDLTLFIERLREAGLPTVYYKWTQNMLGVPEEKRGIYSEPRPYTKINLGDQRVAFAILFVGYFSSLIVFVAEVWRAKRNGKHVKAERC